MKGGEHGKKLFSTWRLQSAALRLKSHEVRFTLAHEKCWSMLMQFLINNQDKLFLRSLNGMGSVLKAT